MQMTDLVDSSSSGDLVLEEILDTSIPETMMADALPEPRPLDICTACC
jgi:hypothetical protein